MLTIMLIVETIISALNAEHAFICRMTIPGAHEHPNSQPLGGSWLLTILSMYFYGYDLCKTALH